jgi:Zn-dependent alcohol dehydrogenase
MASSAKAPSLRLAEDGSAVNVPMGLGLFAELIPVDAAAAVCIDPDIPVEKLGTLGCAVMTGTGAVLHSARVWPGATVAVIGCGGIGLAAVQGAAAVNANQVIAVDLTDQKLEWARRLGATHTVNAAEVDAVEEVRTLTGGHGVDFSFEAVGSAPTVEQAVAMLAFGGTATMIGFPPNDARITLPIGGPDGMFHTTTTLMVTHGGDGLPMFDLPLFAQMYRDGSLDLDTMVSHEVSLDDLGEGFDHMRASDSIRTVVRF